MRTGSRVSIDIPSGDIPSGDTPSRRPLLARWLHPLGLAAACALLALAALTGTAHAQVATTGSLRGLVTDADTGAPLAGAVITVSGAALIEQADLVVEDDGSYELSNLPPGLYTVSVFAGGVQVNRSGVLVQLGKQARADITLASGAGEGEVIEIAGRAPLIDQGSSKTGVTITEDYTRNVPTGRNFDDVLEVAPGAQSDRFGTSFAGSTSPENRYVVEGLNVTGVGFGLATLTLPHEFLSEIEVVGGAYGAEYGRSTGGIANVLTKAGGDRIRGSVFGYVSPGGLRGSEKLVLDQGNALTYRRDLRADTDFGVEVGGPLIPEKLWFHAGFSPSIQLREADTLVEGRRDAVEEVNSQTYYFTSKLSYAASADHGGSLSVFGNPSINEVLNDEFAVGPPNAINFENEQGVVAGTARWTSRFFEGDGELTAALGLYRGRDRQQAKYGSADARQSVRFLDSAPAARLRALPAGARALRRDGLPGHQLPDWRPRRLHAGPQPAPRRLAGLPPYLRRRRAASGQGRR